MLWTFYILLALCALLIFEYFFPEVKLSRRLTVLALRFLCFSCRKIYQLSVWAFNLPTRVFTKENMIKFFWFVVTLPGKITYGVIALVIKIIEFIPKLPDAIFKMLRFLWKPDSEEKESKIDIIEEMRRTIESYQLGPPLDEIEIQHIFYIGYYHHFGHVAPRKIVDAALGAYVARHDMDELPTWMKTLIRKYEDDKSLEQLDLPRWPRFRRKMVDNWLKKNPCEISTIDQLHALPWWMKSLIGERHREKVDTVKLIQQLFSDGLPKEQ